MEGKHHLHYSLLKCHIENDLERNRVSYVVRIQRRIKPHS